MHCQHAGRELWQATQLTVDCRTVSVVTGLVLHAMAMKSGVDCNSVSIECHTGSGCEHCVAYQRRPLVNDYGGTAGPRTYRARKTGLTKTKLCVSINAVLFS